MYAHLNEQMATQHQTEMREQAAAMSMYGSAPRKPSSRISGFFESTA